jgi:hypothetical protein
MSAGSGIRLPPEKSVLGLEAGDKVALNEADFALNNLSPEAPTARVAARFEDGSMAVGDVACRRRWRELS